MRVAFDVGVALESATGIRRYVDSLGSELAAKDVEMKRFQVSLRGRPIERVARWRMPARLSRFLWQRFDTPPIERLVGDVDVVHGTNFILPARRSAAGVVTIHDVAYANPEGFPANARSGRWAAWSAARADAVIVPTQAVAAEVAAHHRIAEDRIHVTPEGVAPDFFDVPSLDDAALAKMGIRKPFILAFGAIQPRKNLVRLLDAWTRVADRLPGWKLVLAGPPGWGPKLPKAPRVITPGWVSEAQAPGLLAAANIFCFPSLYEGFGIPPLEAMAAGTPVLAGDYSAANETLGDAALIVDRHDTRALAEGLIALANDDTLRKQLRSAGRQRAANFTWDRTADLTIEVYRSVMG
jgi:glycosyltransferase involved in cell wall biosynthesis